MGPWARTVRCFPAVDQDIQGDTEGTRHMLGAGACGWKSGIAGHHSLWPRSFQLCPLCGVHQSKQFPWEAESQFRSHGNSQILPRKSQTHHFGGKRRDELGHVVPETEELLKK